MIKDYTGEQFGDYVLKQLLGEGGFASVYRGEHIKDKANAAVKVLKQQEVHDFINEVRRQVLLKHPNIVRVLDFSIRPADNTAFLVMEYAANGTLRKRHPRESRVPPEIVISYVQQIASALQYAHDQKVIHRDVKPENFLLNASNAVLLSDFGIATRSTTVWSAGKIPVIGTYAYMAPEQFEGQPSRASDQYALAVATYEWLCGDLPFYGSNHQHWASLHQKIASPSLCEKNPSLSSAIEAVVLKALSKDLSNRFECVADFATALTAAVGYVITEEPLPNKEDDSIETLHQKAIKAQAHGDIETAYRTWRQLASLPDTTNNIYIVSAQKNFQVVRRDFMELCVDQARKAHMEGNWQKEIELWEDLLRPEWLDQPITPIPSQNQPQQIKPRPLNLRDSITPIPSQNRPEQIKPIRLLNLLEPIVLSQNQPKIVRIGQVLDQPELTRPNSLDSSTISERIKIAKQNIQFVRMYEKAEEFIRESDNLSAKMQLQTLWRDAPYYGDPKGLATSIKIWAGLNYEQALKQEQARQEQARQKQARQEQAQQKQARQEQDQQKRARQKRKRGYIFASVLFLATCSIFVLIIVKMGTFDWWLLMWALVSAIGLAASGYLVAESLYLQVFMVFHEWRLGEGRTGRAWRLRNLANRYWTQEKYSEALLLYRRVLAIYVQQKSPGYDIQDVQKSYVSLLRKLGREEEAALIESGGDVPDEAK